MNIIYHKQSGKRLATLWLRRYGEKDFRVVRDGFQQIRYFHGDCPHEKHRNGMEPAVDEAIEFVHTLDKNMYDAYELIIWTPQRYACGAVGGS